VGQYLQDLVDTVLQKAARDYEYHLSHHDVLVLSVWPFSKDAPLDIALSRYQEPSPKPKVDQDALTAYEKLALEVDGSAERLKREADESEHRVQAVQLLQERRRWEAEQMRLKRANLAREKQRNAQTLEAESEDFVIRLATAMRANPILKPAQKPAPRIAPEVGQKAEIDSAILDRAMALTLKGMMPPKVEICERLHQGTTDSFSA